MTLHIIQRSAVLAQQLIDHEHSIIILIGDGVYCWPQLSERANFYIIKTDLTARIPGHHIDARHLIDYQDLLVLTLQHNTVTW
jgi:sulfur relay protein TusB/DsrH